MREVRLWERLERQRGSIGVGCGELGIAGDGSEGVDEEGSKDGDEGRDDVGAGMASGHKGASLGRRV